MARKRAEPGTNDPPASGRVTRARAVFGEESNGPPNVETVPQTHNVKEIKPKLKKTQGSASEGHQGTSKKDRARKAVVKPNKAKRARDTDSPPHLVPEVHSSALPLMIGNNEMPELHEPMSPQPTEGHEVLILDAPTQAESTREREQDIIPPNVPVASQRRERIPRLLRSSFFKEHTADWQYQSTTIPAVDIQDFAPADIIQMRNHFWHYMKALTGCQLRVVMTEQLTSPSPKMIFEVLGFLNKKGRRTTGTGLPLASTTAFFQRGQRTNFVFKIIDSELAKAHKISIQIIKEAAEDVFETTILRCVDPDGENSQVSAEDIEVLSTEVEMEFDRKPRSFVAP